MENNQYKEIIDNAVFGYAYHRIIVDENEKAVDYEFLEVNRAFEDFTGLDRDAVIGKRIKDVIVDIDKGSFDWISYYGNIALNGGSVTFEQYLEPKKRWYKVTAHSSTKYYFSTIFIDITKEKRQAEDLEGFFNVNLDLLCIADLKGQFVRVNKAWESILGYTADYLEGKNFLDLVMSHWRSLWDKFDCSIISLNSLLVI